MNGSLFDISGRVACVTGASSGIGRHLATALAKAGAKVVGVARRTAQLEAWRSEAGDGATASVAADLSDPSQMKIVAERVAAPFGSPDILITAAGVNAREAADDVTLDGWSITLAVNLAAPFFLAQALVPAMKAKGWGRIINIASLQTVRAFPGGVAMAHRRPVSVN